MSEASLQMVGVSHRRAAVGLRERVAIAKADPRRLPARVACRPERPGMHYRLHLQPD